MSRRPDPMPPIGGGLVLEAEPPSPATPLAGAAAPTGATGTPPAAFAALIAGNAILAFGPWFVRLADVGPVASGFWRQALALPVLAIVARLAARNRAAVGLPVVLAALAAGIFFGLDIASWHAGILRTRLANSTLFGNVTSFFFVAYGFLMARTWPSRRQAAALTLAVLGVGLLMGRSYQLSPEHVRGDLLCLLAGLSYTGYMIFVDRARARFGTWPTLAFATAAAAATLLPIAWVAGDTIWPHDWRPLVALAAGSQLAGQGLLVYSIGALPPTVVGLGLLTQPVVAAVIGWVVYGERLALPDLIGAAAIAVALVMIRRR